MLLPAINKRAERTLKSSFTGALSRTWLFLHCWLLLFPKIRERPWLHHSACDRIDARSETQERGKRTQRRGKSGSRMAVSMKDAPSNWVSTVLAGELWRRVQREGRSPPVLLAKLSGHWFPGTCSHFLKVKAFPWKAGIKIFCCTIFSLPGGHPAPLRDICKHQTTSPVLLCFCFPVWPITSLFIMTSILSLSFTPLSRTCPPSLLLTSPPLRCSAFLCVGEKQLCWDTSTLAPFYNLLFSLGNHTFYTSPPSVLHLLLSAFER